MGVCTDLACPLEDRFVMVFWSSSSSFDTSFCRSTAASSHSILDWNALLALVFVRLVVVVVVLAVVCSGVDCGAALRCGALLLLFALAVHFIDSHKRDREEFKDYSYLSPPLVQHRPLKKQ